jgi:hypothetical protein
VGDRWKVSVLAQSSAKAGDPPEMQVSEYVSEYSVKILETNGPAPSRLALSFETNMYRYQQRGAMPTVIDGKQYIVDANAPHVRDPLGAAAPAEEVQRVLDVVPDLGTRTQVDQLLPESAMAIGEARDELAGGILRVIHPRAWTLEKGTAVLERTVDEEAVFSITLDATGGNGIRMDVKGEARVRIKDARLTSIALDGTYTHASDEPGTFTLRRFVKDL